MTAPAEAHPHSDYFVELENVTLSYGRGDKKIHAFGFD